MSTSVAQAIVRAGSICRYSDFGELPAHRHRQAHVFGSVAFARACVQRAAILAAVSGLPQLPLPPGGESSNGVISEQCSHTENKLLVAEETFLLGLLWGCFVTALLLKRKAIKQVCCDAGAKITSTHEPYISHLETDDHDARTQAAIEDSINHAEDLPPSPPPAQNNGAGPSSFGDIELAEVKPTRREL